MVILDGKTMNVEKLVRIARHKEEVAIDKDNVAWIDRASDFVKEAIKDDHPIYGINTGFGHLSNVMIKKDEIEKLQTNLLKSHACGMGEPLPNEVVRAMMALRINALIKGYSGIRMKTLDLLVQFLNQDIIPVVYEKGSLGASGDLALLSHMSLPLIGLGEVYHQGRRMPSKDALAKCGIAPLETLKAKEGLSLINGTQAMNAIGALVLYDAFLLLDHANMSLALTMEALEGILDAFDPRIHELREQHGQTEIARIVHAYIKNSKNITRQGVKRVQDAYSIRCAPQVHGATLDALLHVKTIIEREMNAVTDNPIIFVDTNEAISAGNFHGQPLALAFDYMGIAIAELANISERRIERMVNPALSNGLPPFLSQSSGVNSGFMIVQYTAAALVSENKVLAHPASVDSIPSSGNQEDHVSMGSIAANKSKDILENTRKVIGLELLTATQAIGLRGADGLSDQTHQVYDAIKSYIPCLLEDALMYPYMHQAEDMIKTNELKPFLKGVL